MNVKTLDHKNSSGIIFEPLTSRNLTDIDSRVILSTLADKGYIIFRSFSHSVEKFTELVKSLSVSLSLDPARSFDGDAAQKVDAGIDKVGLHCENGNSPFWPDLCWFYCRIAPSFGSQTTVCDGKVVFEKMDDALRDAFQKRIKYSRVVSESKWKLYAFQTSLNRGKEISSIEHITIEHLKSLVDDDNDSKIILLEDGSIEYSFETTPIRSSRINKKLNKVFANSIFGPSNHYSKPTITYTNGTPLLAEHLDRMESLCEELTFNIDWKEGDIVLIDNTRVMHGRRAIEDQQRLIFNALSYI